MTDDQIKMLDEILYNEDAGLSGKEMDFIEQLDANRKRVLSEKQEDWLKSIWDRACK